MKTHEPLTPVMFRHGRELHDVYALFPTLAGDMNPETCTCYQQTGQHCTAVLTYCVRSSRPATRAEYASLARELRGRGYRLKIVNRTPRNAYALRRAQIK
jgi:hypothetical protein